MNNEYVVKKGETLWEISKKIYGTGELYHIIAKENKIANPDTIQNGQIIKIPDVEFYTEKEVLEEAEKCEEYKKEIDRLNNILDELENTIVNFIENHTESYIDWKYDREIYLAESNILQKLFDTYLDKLKELKENK